VAAPAGDVEHLERPVFAGGRLGSGSDRGEGDEKGSKRARNEAKKAKHEEVLQKGGGEYHGGDRRIRSSAGMTVGRGLTSHSPR
jgi:hypothetical protein